MSLSKEQHDFIMRGYEERRLNNYHQLNKRKQRVYTLIPEYKLLEDQVATASVARARMLIDGDEAGLEEYRRKIAENAARRADLLAELNLPADYLEPLFTCPDCQDTGYIHSEKCHCFRKQEITLLYEQSNIQEMIEKENFSTFSYEYYSDKDRNPTTGLSSLDAVKDAVEKCRHFIDDFDNKPKNLLFYGNTGIGKTFLSNCVAKELLERGNSVIYFTAFQLFDILSKGVFDRDADALAAHHNIFDCDLLIIDDLGTEPREVMDYGNITNPTVDILTRRYENQLFTIISTNLTPPDFSQVYGERIADRMREMMEKIPFNNYSYRSIK